MTAHNSYPHPDDYPKVQGDLFDPMPASAPAKADLSSSLPDPERQKAVGDFQDAFDRVTTEPISEISGYKAGQAYREKNKYDPYLFRNETFRMGDAAGITFRVDATPERPSIGVIREDMVLFNPTISAAVIEHHGLESYYENSAKDDRGNVVSKTHQDTIIETVTGKEVLGTLVDYGPAHDDPSIAVGRAQYVLVKDTDGRQDVLRLPMPLGKSVFEEKMLEGAGIKLTNPNSIWARGHEAITEDMLRQVFAARMQPAAPKDIRDVTEKLRSLIRGYGRRITNLQEAEAARAAAHAHSQTFAGKVGSLATKLGFRGKK
jgi:hypothetical protein